MTLFPFTNHACREMVGRGEGIVKCGFLLHVFLGTILFFSLVGSIPVFAVCPSSSEIENKFEQLAKRKGNVISLQPSKVPGICEVAIRHGSQVQIFYTDQEAKFFFFGRLIDANTGSNLTSLALADINRLTPEEMEELSVLTAFSIGNDAAQVLYYVTDPQCPYCKQGEEDLKRMSEAGEVHARFLLFPLPSHKGAREQCISLICDKKGLEEFKSGYHSENQCEEGRMLVDSTVDFLRKKGITATPTYIFRDGRIHTGLLGTPELERWLGP